MKKIMITTVSVLALFTLGACSYQKAKTKDSSKIEKSYQVTKKSSKKSEKEVSKAFQVLIKQNKPIVEKVKETYDDVYSDAELTAEYPETFVSIYTYKNKIEISPEEKDHMFKQLVVLMKSEVDKYKKQFPNFQERVIYLNPDKSEAASFLITQKDVEKVAASSIEKS